MSHSQLTDRPDLLTLAKRGDPNAIAILLNQTFTPNGISVKVGSHSNCLGILLESTPVPDQDDMVAAIRSILTQLQPASVYFVKIAGYHPAQKIPTWYEEIELESALTLTPSSYQPPSIESWLNQGLEPSGYHSFAFNPIPSSPTLERRFLRFSLNEPETALLPLNQIQQVLKVPLIEILPVPHMPDCILGIYSWRGEPLWLIDLAQQLGFSSPLTDLRTLATLNTIVIQIDRNSLGLVVPRPIDIETHNLQQLQPPQPGLFPTQLSFYLQGYFITPSPSPLLNPTKLLQDPLLSPGSV